MILSDYSCVSRTCRVIVAILFSLTSRYVHMCGLLYIICVSLIYILNVFSFVALTIQIHPWGPSIAFISYHILSSPLLSSPFKLHLQLHPLCFCRSVLTADKLNPLAQMHQYMPLYIVVLTFPFPVVVPTPLLELYLQGYLASKLRFWPWSVSPRVVSIITPQGLCLYGACL